MAQTTDSLGRELQTTAPRAQTVTQFAVEQGTIDNTESVQAAVKEEKRRAQEGTERAKRVSEQMAAPAVGETVQDTPEEDDQG